MAAEINTPKPLPIGMVPSLPTGEINGNTVDCVNVSDYQIDLI